MGEVRGKLGGVGSLLPLCLRDPTQAVSLVSDVLYLLSRLSHWSSHPALRCTPLAQPFPGPLEVSLTPSFLFVRESQDLHGRLLW